MPLFTPLQLMIQSLWEMFLKFVFSLGPLLFIAGWLFSRLIIAASAVDE